MGHNKQMSIYLKSDQDETEPATYAERLPEAVKSPDKFKMCLVCGHIVGKEEALCPHCKAYRFEEEASVVSNAALSQLTHERSCVSDIGDFDDD